MTRKLPELLTGFAILIIAAVFLVYALGQTGNLAAASGYPLQAQFSSVGGLTTGADVKIGGVLVGHVADEHLDPQTYAAIVKLTINPDIKIPDDSAASITSDGLLSGDYVNISPGGSDTMLAPGQAFQSTQSAINIEDLLGKFIFSMGNSNTSKPASSSSAPAAPANPAALPTGPATPKQ